MSDNVIYLRDEKYSQMSASEDENQDNIWDDTLLIKAYERAVNSAKEKVATKLNLENGVVNQESNLQSSQSHGISPDGKASKQRKHTQKRIKEEWTVGMNCRAAYSEDGRDYEALILNIDQKTGMALIKYLGYNNEEAVSLDQLKTSFGHEAQKIQTTHVQNGKQPFHSKAEKLAAEPGQSREKGMIPPPPPPHVMAHFPKDESDALSAMLMAWYMSGYHTGYYQGLTQSKTSSQLNSCNSHFK